MELVVAQDGWGEARPADVEALLANVAVHLVGRLRDGFEEMICVAPAPPGVLHPRTLNRYSSDAPVVIWLTARDRRWAKYSFQFGHELCHAVQPYEQLFRTANSWFQESMCEVASLFVLRRMSETWRADPPFPNWADYAGALSGYAEERLQCPAHQLPSEMTLSRWVASQEDSLRRDHEQRDKNAVIAGELLPLFEDNPAGWNAIRRFPVSSARFKDYLSEWRDQVDSVDRGFAETIIRRFEE